MCPQKFLVSLFKFNHLDRDFSYTCVVAHPEIHLAKVDSRKSFIFHRFFSTLMGEFVVFLVPSIEATRWVAHPYGRRLPPGCELSSQRRGEGEGPHNPP